VATTGSIPVAIGGVASASTGWAEITGPLQLGIANAGVGDTMAAGWFGWRVLGGTPAACSKNTTINNMRWQYGLRQLSTGWQLAA
jgi:hypothetical protein